jgi:hypothetical protein
LAEAVIVHHDGQVRLASTIDEQAKFEGAICVYQRHGVEEVHGGCDGKGVRLRRLNVGSLSGPLAKHHVRREFLNR